MTRPLLVRLAACLVTGLVVVGLCPATAAPAQAADAAPLEVTIDSMSPSTIPRSGRITVTGQVTNRTDETWSDLNAYLLTSAEPFTSAAELEAANETDPAAVIGARLTEPGLFDPIGDLAPRSTTDFVLSVPRRQLQISGDAGVYWLGVHVLGASQDGFDAVADGRARTFIPLMRPRGPSTTLSLLLPIKAPVRRAPDGSLADLAAWQELLGPEGRLGRLVALSGTSIDVPVTWVLDPAVLDAAMSVANDNPPMSIAPTDGGEPDDEPPSPNAGDSESPTAEAPSEPPEDEPAEVSQEAQQAATWINLVQQQAEEHTVLTVPYADVDVASMARRGFLEIYEQAVALSERTMDGFGIEAQPVVAPPPGVLPRPALAELDPDTPLVLSDAAAPEATTSVVETPRGHSVLLTDSAAGAGGPGPTPPFQALAMRQRILGEAAVHALSDRRDQPLVVSTPQQWDPGSDWRIAQFFFGLDVPWLRGIDARSAFAAGLGDTGREYDAPLRYPRRQTRVELSIPNLLATEELARTGSIFADLLTRNDTVDEFLTKSAALASSYHARKYRARATARARDTTRRVRSLMDEIHVEGPPFVTMSSEQGTFQVTVVNDLTEPVTVGVRAETRSDDLVITEPDPVSLGPGQRASVRLRATAQDIGVHSVTVTPVNSNGDPLGSAATFSVRSSQVGLVIWLIMGLGAGILVITLGVRVFRRVRARKATPGPLLESSR